jgi:hypothetical protein
MPLIKSHSKEAREKNIKEMIAAGHDPKQAVAAAYANQRKYKKMAEGGLIEDDSEEHEKIESEIGDGPFRGMFELQEQSHEENDQPEHHNPLIKALHGADQPKNGGPESEIGEDIVSLPESYFASMAEKIIQARKKKKAIQP